MPLHRVERSAEHMVLRCPRCSALKFFGRTQVLGELVVCPKCGHVEFLSKDSPLLSELEPIASDIGDGD